MTLLTPVTPEGLVSLQGLIDQDALMLNEVSKRHLRKHLQKLANAAAISFAKRALQKEQIQFQPTSYRGDQSFNYHGVFRIGSVLFSLPFHFLHTVMCLGLCFVIGSPHVRNCFFV